MTKKSLRKYSKKIVDGVEQAPSRAMLRAVGFKEGDFIFFLNGHSENGNYRSRVSADLEKLFNGINAKMLDELIFSSSIFWESLPTTKIYNILKFYFGRFIKINSDKYLIPVLFKWVSSIP